MYNFIINSKTGGSFHCLARYFFLNGSVPIQPINCINNESTYRPGSVLCQLGAHLVCHVLSIVWHHDLHICLYRDNEMLLDFHFNNHVLQLDMVDTVEGLSMQLWICLFHACLLGFWQDLMYNSLWHTKPFYTSSAIFISDSIMWQSEWTWVHWSLYHNTFLNFIKFHLKYIMHDKVSPFSITDFKYVDVGVINLLI